MALCGLTLKFVSPPRVAKVLPYVRGDREEVNLNSGADDVNVKEKAGKLTRSPSIAEM